MSLSTIVRAGLASIVLSTPALAADITVLDPFARSSGHHAKSGAAFMVLRNDGAHPDRLLGARSEVAQRVELHTHVMDDGVAKMRKVEDGISLAPGEAYSLERGGDHVMFMGLNQALNEGDTVTVILSFEKAGDVIVEVPVNLSR